MKSHSRMDYRENHMCNMLANSRCIEDEKYFPLSKQNGLNYDHVTVSFSVKYSYMYLIFGKLKGLQIF